MIIPIGHDQSLRRLPWLTMGIMALCLLVQVRASLVSVDEDQLAILLVQQRALVSDWLREALLGPLGKQLSPTQLLMIPGLASTPGAEQLIPPGPGAAIPDSDDAVAPDPVPPDPALMAEALDRLRHVSPADVARKVADFRAGRGVTPDDPRRVRWLELQAQIEGLLRGDPTIQLGYRPVDGISIRMVLYAFAHGGWLHLLGNLLFLWLVGCNLEDRWGRAAFGAFYLAGAWGAALAFRIVHPGSDTLLVGASGAIAAAMGAFLVNFHDVEIRFAYLWLWLPPRWGTFEARAMFVMPLWFLQDLLSAWFFEADGAHAVAYSAHVGGFALGVAIALGLRWSGIEQKRLIPAASKGVEWAEDPEVLRALDLIDRGQHAEAIALLRPVLARTPRHPSAAIDLVRSAVASGDEAAVKEFLDRAVQLLWRDRRQVDLVDLAADINRRWRRWPWSEASLASTARAQVACSYLDRAEHSLRRLMGEFPGGVQEVRVRHELADVLEQTGQFEESRLLAQSMVNDFPEHALTPAARERMARLEGRPDRVTPERIAETALARGGVEMPSE